MADWAYDLTKGLAHWIVYRQCLHRMRITEGAFQNEAENLLHAHWQHCIEANFDLSDFIVSNARGRPPQADIALFSRENKMISVIELKIATSAPKTKAGKSRGALLQFGQLKKDLEHLTEISRKEGVNCACFLIIAGNVAQIRKVARRFSLPIFDSKHPISPALPKLTNELTDVDGLAAIRRAEVINPKIRAKRSDAIACCLWEIFHKRPSRRPPLPMPSQTSNGSATSATKKIVRCK